MIALDYYLSCQDHNYTEYTAMQIALEAERKLGCGFEFYYRLAMQSGYDVAETVMMQELAEVAKAEEIAGQYAKITCMLQAYNFCTTLEKFNKEYC